jgi:hypothetical protein
MFAFGLLIGLVIGCVLGPIVLFELIRWWGK